MLFEHAALNKANAACAESSLPVLPCISVVRLSDRIVTLQRVLLVALPSLGCFQGTKPLFLCRPLRRILSSSLLDWRDYAPLNCVVPFQ